MDIVCLMFFVFQKYFRTTWIQSVSKFYKLRFAILLVISAVTVFDLILSAIIESPPYTSNAFRPITFLLFSQNARGNMKFIALLIKDSAIIFMSIFVYVFFFSLVGFFLFHSGMEGFIEFSTPLSSMYHMYITFTTANFPNVMLPAYNSNRFTCLFFCGYLIFGLYFL